MRKIRSQRKSLLLFLVIRLITVVVSVGGCFQTISQAQSTVVEGEHRASRAFKNVNMLGEMGCATVPADATIVLPNQVGPGNHPPNWFATSPGSTYDHGSACKDQFIVEVQNTINQGTFWIMGGDVWPPPDNKIKCNAMRIEVATYGLVPLFGWTNHYNYIVRGRWKTSPSPTCDYTFSWDPGWPPLAKRHFTKVRAAVKVTTVFGLKQRAMGGVLFN